ncbi:hypothetical protein QCA50_010341 [Cerrena zonata]|uniref:Uncharacterized protein n=1 Tax=Cerrena zonata TaxID=2478898 RepID=A0AAW0G139_9APHY
MFKAILFAFTFAAALSGVVSTPVPDPNGVTAGMANFEREVKRDVSARMPGSCPNGSQCSDI